VVITDPPFHSTPEPLTKPAPVAVRVKPGEPAVTELGLMVVRVTAESGKTVKVSALEAGAPVSKTVMATVPATASWVVVTCAVSWVELMKVVASDEPFHSTVAPERKFEPEIVRVKAALPAVAEVGEREASAGGDAGTMVKTTASLGLAPGLMIVILAVPGVAMNEAGTWAVTCEELTYVVVSEVPFHCTTAPDKIGFSEPVVTVIVNAGPPATAELG